MTTKDIGTVEVNGANIYHRVVGQGPPVLFIAGGVGMGTSSFAEVARLLSDEFTVVTYDRRGHGRSPRPQGWESTSLAEQAADAAGLIDALKLGPTAVFGTSAGGMVSLKLIENYPDKLAGVILNEPALAAPDQREAGKAHYGSSVGAVLESQGIRAAAEAFVRQSAGDLYDSLPQDTFQEMLDSAEVLVGYELGVLDAISSGADTSDLVDAAGKTGVPIMVMSAPDGRPLNHLSHRWCAERLGVEFRHNPRESRHRPYVIHPEETVDLVRPFLKRVHGLYSSK